MGTGALAGGNMTNTQKQILTLARDRALKLKQMADNARSAGLPITERYLREASVNCQMAADFQEAQLVTPKPDEAKAKALGFLPHEEARQVPWAEVAAETIKRRGLL